MSGYGLAIFSQHAAQLEASAIDPDVARERGYRSADSGKQLERFGFRRWQCKWPSLVIPLHRADGSVWGYQHRPDSPRVTRAGSKIKYETPSGQSNDVDIPPRIRDRIGDPAVPLLVTEGSKKADSAVSAGLACVSLNGVSGSRRTNEHGGKVMAPGWQDIALNGRRIIMAFDSDVTRKVAVQRELRKLAGYLESKGAKVEYLHLPDDAGGKTGLDDYLAAEGAGRLWSLVRPDLPALTHAPEAPRHDPNVSGKVPSRPWPDVTPQTIGQVEATYARWLHDKDKVTTRVVHAVYVANMILGGDAVWVFLVGGSGSGKTERLVPLATLPPVVLASSISGEAALLSATPRKDRAEHAHGGLLRRVGDKGILVLKDFTTILEMDRTARGAVLAALREIYDGRWDRDVGTDGGQTLTWAGKCGFLAGCTGAIDRAHGVMAEMGPRSLFVRLPAADLDAIGRSALDHMGREDTMRRELADATAGLLTHLTAGPHDLGDDVKAGLIGLANLVSQGRSPVQRDWKGEIELVLDAEAPTRIIKQLGQIWRACGVLGLDGAASWEVVRRCALDSIPKLRGSVIRYLASRADPADTTTVGLGVVHPTRTVRRALEDLAAHGVADRKSAGKGHADEWQLSGRARDWIDAAGTLPETLESGAGDDDSRVNGTPEGTCEGCNGPMRMIYGASQRFHPSCEPGAGS